MEPEEDEEEEDEEEGTQQRGELNPTPVTPQKRAEKAGEKRRRLRRRRRRLACNVAPLVLVQLTSWPVSLLVLVEPVVQG